MQDTSIMKIVPVILSGGTGSRLWPLSRASFPKQLWPLITEKSMFQDTVLRGKGDIFLEPIVICNQDHRFLIAEQLREIGVENARIVLEPVGRNSAPAIATASLLANELDAQTILWVMAADAYIQDVPKLVKLVEEAAAFAQNGKIVTFGIQPTRLETGYGYIEKGSVIDKIKNIYAVKAFTEKPDIRQAQLMVESGGYLWNSGMFMFSAQTMLQEMKHYTPTLLSLVKKAVDNRQSDLYFERILYDDFIKVPDLSIDYAIAEKTKAMVVVSADLVWSDIGSWNGLWNVSQKDRSGNVVIGNVFLENTHNSYIRSEEMVAAVNDIDNVVVIVTKDAVLVSDRNKSQNVKKIVQKLNAVKQQEAVRHNQCYRPWGHYETLAHGERFLVKQLIVKTGAQLSLQKHHHRSEHWVIVSGIAEVTRGDEVIFLHENESVYIPLGMVHRLKNAGDIPLIVIEIQSGSYLDESDIVRLDDQYHRIV